MVWLFDASIESYFLWKFSPLITVIFVCHTAVSRENHISTRFHRFALVKLVFSDSWNWYFYCNCLTSFRMIYTLKTKVETPSSSWVLVCFAKHEENRFLKSGPTWSGAPQVVTVMLQKSAPSMESWNFITTRRSHSKLLYGMKSLCLPQERARMFLGAPGVISTAQSRGDWGYCIFFGVWIVSEYFF